MPFPKDRGTRVNVFFFSIVVILVMVVSVILIERRMMNTRMSLNPYQMGFQRFDDELTSQSTEHPSNHFTVYVAPGVVTTGWFWFRKQNPVVYTSLEYTGTATIKDIAVKFGPKTVTSPEERTGPAGGSVGLGFSFKTTRIPQKMNISWQQDGQLHRLQIDASSMVELPFVNVPPK